MRDQEIIGLYEAYNSIYASSEEVAETLSEEVIEEKRIAHGTGKKVMPSKKERSKLAKRARAGEDIGKKGKGFEAVAEKAAKRYGSKEAGERVAAAAMFRQQAHKEEFETWVNALVEEGYDLSEHTWDEMYEIYLNEDKAYDRARKRAAQRAAARNEARRQGLTGSVPGVGYVSGTRPERETYTDSEGVVRHHTGGRMPNNEETDLFDCILEYLVAEGYADTNENALVIMANMSEEWRQSILEEPGKPASARERFRAIGGLVNVDTASSPGEGKKDPYRFRTNVGVTGA